MLGALPSTAFVSIYKALELIWGGIVDIMCPGIVTGAWAYSSSSPQPGCMFCSKNLPRGHTAQPSKRYRLENKPFISVCTIAILALGLSDTTLGPNEAEGGDV